MDEAEQLDDIGREFINQHCAQVLVRAKPGQVLLIVNMSRLQELRLSRMPATKPTRGSDRIERTSSGYADYYLELLQRQARS